MSTRRTFLKMNLAVVGATVLSPSAPALADMPRRSVDLFVFDTELPEAQLLAKRASGLKALPTGGDLYPIWRDTLRASLMASPKTVAGLTSGEAAFCLAEVARDYGYRMVQSAPFDPRQGFDPLRVKDETLTTIELNRPVPVAWVLARDHKSFHALAASV